ncbi:MAG TPA: glutamyl-tRNA reductase [Planctomycetota bacterium]|nr:glutamyl-tRNA reductase [Planctomycetota bacterium]
MGVVLVGMNHRTAPVELREKAAFDAETTRRGLEDLARRTRSAEAVILSTCNRVEVTAFRDDETGLVETVEAFLADFHGLEAGTLAPHLYRLRGAEAVTHLFRVAASLDSMVPGESQILAQVKDAYLMSAEAGCTGKHLNVLFQRAFRVGKLVHTHTDIARHKVSVSSVAVDLARGILGDLSDRTVLVLGAGETGKLTLRSLVESGVGKLLLANRTRERAEEVAERFRGSVVEWTELTVHLARADIVISGTSSHGFVLGREDVSGALTGRGGRPLLIIDIAVPRDVHPSVAELPGVHLHDIDDLERVVAENVDRREQEFQRSLELIEREVEDFESWFERHETEEVIGVLLQRARDASKAELEKLWAEHPDIDPEHRREVNAAVERLVNRIMHQPIEVLKAEAASHSPTDFSRIVRLICPQDDRNDAD